MMLTYEQSLERLKHKEQYTREALIDAVYVIAAAMERLLDQPEALAQARFALLTLKWTPDSRFNWAGDAPGAHADMALCAFRQRNPMVEIQSSPGETAVLFGFCVSVGVKMSEIL